MRFIEMTGKTLMSLVQDGELEPEAIKNLGITDNCLVRVNLHGDIEIRRKHGWDIVGGLLGEFEERVKRATHYDWA